MVDQFPFQIIGVCPWIRVWNDTILGISPMDIGVDMGCAKEISSFYAIYFVKLPSYRITNAKPGGILNRHPGKNHSGKLNDPEQHKQQDRESNDEFHHCLTPTFPL